MIKIHPVKCEAYDEVDDLVFTLNTFDSECHELTIKALVDAENWPHIATAVSFTLAYMSAGLIVADPPNAPPNATGDHPPRRTYDPQTLDR